MSEQKICVLSSSRVLWSIVPVKNKKDCSIVAVIIRIILWSIVPVKDSDQSVDFKEAKDQTDDFLQHQSIPLENI